MAALIFFQLSKPYLSTNMSNDHLEAQYLEAFFFNASLLFLPSVLQHNEGSANKWTAARTVADFSTGYVKQNRFFAFFFACNYGQDASSEQH